MTPTNAPYFNEKLRHIVVATGGTGGHFHPALAIARTAMTKDMSVTLVVAGHNLEKHLELAEKFNIPSVVSSAPRLPKRKIALPWFLLRMTHSLLTARKICKSLKPDAVLGMGSFACFPFCLAAATGQIPLFLHEGNAVVGRANRMLAKFAKQMLLSLPLADAQPRCETRVTGFPLRPELIAAATRQQPATKIKKTLGFDPARPLLLAFGGSQGAAFINEILPAALLNMHDRGKHIPQILHLAGDSEASKNLQTAYNVIGADAQVANFTDNMHDCYQAADFVVSRAGGATIAELAMFGKYAILIPYLAATDAHQSKNAQTLHKNNAAVVIPQNECDADKLADAITTALENKDQQQTLKTNIAELATAHAAKNVLTTMLDYYGT